MEWVLLEQTGVYWVLVWQDGTSAAGEFRAGQRRHHSLSEKTIAKEEKTLDSWWRQFFREITLFQNHLVLQDDGFTPCL